MRWRRLHPIRIEHLPRKRGVDRTVLPFGNGHWSCRPVDCRNRECQLLAIVNQPWARNKQFNGRCSRRALGLSGGSRRDGPQKNQSECKASLQGNSSLRMIMNWDVRINSTDGSCWRVARVDGLELVDDTERWEDAVSIDVSEYAVGRQRLAMPTGLKC